jgi:cell division protein FtsN
VKTESKKTVYRVQVGSYSSKANAEKMLKKLKEAGYEGFVVSAEI